MTGLIKRDYGYIDFDYVDDEVESIDEDGNETYRKPFVQIFNLFVSSDFRGQGKARELLQDAGKEIRAEFGNITIKIVACPKEKGVDLDRLASFYESFDLEVIA
jgi:GNAT superfamily N-acetyltransferase